MRLNGAFSSTVLLIVSLATVQVSGQRITTIQLDGVQYYISRMNPYSAELNYFLSYQFCRSLGLQLASFETKEKADSIMQYLGNAGYSKYDFWIAGNKLGTNMFLWMSTGIAFNTTFNYMKKTDKDIVTPGSASPDIPSGSTSPQRTSRGSGDGGIANSCVAMKAPKFEWDVDSCFSLKDFICEQTRCYYFNYGPITVSSSQGKPVYTTTTRPYSSTTEQVPVGINDFLNTLRASTAAPAESNDLDSITAINQAENEDSDLEQSTNGPYNNLHSNVALQDDPAVNFDKLIREEDIASTYEPDTATNFVRSSNPSSY